jgi:hypothetical protein
MQRDGGDAFISALAFCWVTLYHCDAQSMMATVSDFALLTSVLPDLLKVSGRLTGDSEDAKAAREAINKNSPLENSFHGTIYTKLDMIHSTLLDWSERKYDNSPAVQGPVRNLLCTLEDMVAEVSPHQQSPYPGLTYIKGIADSDSLLCSDFEKIHSTIKSCFTCPEVQVCDQLLTAVSECAEALNTSSLAFSIRDIAQDEGLLLPIERMCDRAMKIEDAIKHGLNCIPCGCQHEAVFSFATPCYGQGASGNCLMSFRRHGSTQVWVSARVALERSHEDFGSRSGVRLCEVLLSSSTETHLEPLTNGFTAIQTQEQPRKTSAVSLTSFKTWVANEQSDGYAKNNEKNRLILTLLLSYAYLYLGGSSWWPNARLDSGLWFADHLDDKIIRPFLQFSTAKEHQKWAVEKCINPVRPSLPAFGKLILEIWLGRPITWGEEDMQGVINDCQRSALGPHIYGIANSCIEADPILKGEGRLRDNLLMKKTFVSNVVKTLQYMSRFAGVTPQQIVKLLETQMQTDSRIGQHAKGEENVVGGAFMQRYGFVLDHYPMKTDECPEQEQILRKRGLIRWTSSSI